MIYSESSYCCQLLNTTDLEEVCGAQKNHPLLANVNCTCADYLYCRLAVVTAISSNHFPEAQDMIYSVQRNIPNTKIYVYDLGLSSSERSKLRDLCFVEVRTFPFKQYPPHFRRLHDNEAWKPIIINELAKEYDVILYGDASTRIKKPVKGELIPYLMDFPYVAGEVVFHPVISVTPPEMYNYLGLHLTRSQALKAMPKEFATTMLCVWMNKLMREKFLKYWIDCALHEECMSPKGYIRKTTCHFELRDRPEYNGEFVGCMRCQSIVNILFYREFGGDVWERVQRTLGHVWSVKRSATHKFRPMWCPRK